MCDLNLSHSCASFSLTVNDLPFSLFETPSSLCCLAFEQTWAQRSAPEGSSCFELCMSPSRRGCTSWFLFGGGDVRDNIVTLFIFHVLALLRATLKLCHFSPVWLFNHLRDYQPEFCGKIDYTPDKVLPSAERREVASLAVNGLQSEGEMATVIEMSLRCMLLAACWTVLRSWGACSETGGDIPELNYTKLCYGGHFTFSFESVRGEGENTQTCK